MFHNLKGKFQQVQDGISASFRGLKIKDYKSSTSNTTDVNFDAGIEILAYNEENWNDIHLQAEKNSQKAEAVDKKIVEINSKMRKQLHCIQEINNFFVSLPKLAKKIESISDDLDQLQLEVSQFEEFLVVFEDLVEEEEFKQKQVEERFQLATYIERRSKETQILKKKLAEQYDEKVLQKEKKIQNTLKERQELFNMAFQQDMQLYKESGIVPNTRVKENVPTVSLEDVVIDDDLKDLNAMLDN